MCWSANGSLATWAVAMALAAATKEKTDPKLWLLLLVFTQMQLVEYFLWKNLKVPRLNVLGSQAAMFVILLEPIAAMYMIEDTELRNKMLIAYGVWVAFFLSRRFDFRTTVGGNGHLKWNWLPALMVWAPWFFFFLPPLWISGHHMAFTAALGALVMSSYFFGKYGTFSSMWCWIAVFSWVGVFIQSRS